MLNNENKRITNWPTWRCVVGHHSLESYLRPSSFPPSIEAAKMSTTKKEKENREITCICYFYRRIDGVQGKSIISEE